MAEGALTPLDEHELAGLSSAERAAHYRLACRARVAGDVSVTLAPIVVYSNKIFRACDDHRRAGVPLGLAIDLGSTTVAAFVTTLDAGRVCAGAAALNQQTAFGADVISRLAAAQNRSGDRRARLGAGAFLDRAGGGCAQAGAQRPGAHPQGHHRRQLRHAPPAVALSGRYPGRDPFSAPQTPRRSVSRVTMLGILSPTSSRPGPRSRCRPLIGGFVGSDALACLIYYAFDRAPGPMAAIDLGTNGEVMVTDGRRILVGSTAAGPAFEGVNISCGTRAVDGAIVGARVVPEDGSVALTTVGDQPPVGLTGSGLLALVCELRRADVIDAKGRIVSEHPVFGQRLSYDEEGVRRFLITDQGVDRRGVDADEPGTRVSLYLTQHDVRELQKAKGAIRAAFDTLMAQLDLQPGDLQRMILTGSFGSQLDVDAVLSLGMIPPVPFEVIETSPNGAGFGAALMLDDAEFARGERIAAAAEQVDLDADPNFDRRFIRSLALTPEAGK